MTALTIAEPQLALARSAAQAALEVLPTSRSPWQTAFWFVSTNSWLGGPAPRELLDDEAAVLDAAAHESDEIGG